MSVSFFESVSSLLPEKKSTKLYLVIGALGLLGCGASLVLVFLGNREEHSLELTSVQNFSPLDSPSLPVIPSPPATEAPDLVSSLETRVSVNNDSIERLMELPLIGEKKAQKIIDGRPYSSIEEFFQKNGFGAKTRVQLENLVGL
ncbi:MAG: helix-hairpin-helix domain-containing protein [Candidatus Nitrosotenuis sp.]